MKTVFKLMSMMQKDLDKTKLDDMYAHSEEHFGNARAIRNLFEHAINLQANRLVKDPELTNEELATLTTEDILPAMEVM